MLSVYLLCRYDCRGCTAAIGSPIKDSVLYLRNVVSKASKAVSFETRFVQRVETSSRTCIVHKEKPVLHIKTTHPSYLGRVNSSTIKLQLYRSTFKFYNFPSHKREIALHFRS